jgi:hypothetical protein
MFKKTILALAIVGILTAASVTVTAAASSST